MEEYNVDIEELEKQRYDAIKASGKYLELNVLIGVEKETYKNMEGTIPITSLRMQKCGPTEVGCLYAIINKVKDYLEKEYPIECACSKISMNCTEISSTTTQLDDEEE